eukprot:482333-Amphidinium_carterae.1
MLYLWYSDNNELCCLCAVHVDDLLFVGDPHSEVMGRIRSCFEWGSWNESSLESPSQLVFCGKEITIVPSSSTMARDHAGPREAVPADVHAGH